MNRLDKILLGALGLFILFCTALTVVNASPIDVDMITIEVGAYGSGSFTSLEVIDGDLYTINEVVDPEAIDVRANFTGLSPSQYSSITLEIYGHYEGNPAHEVNVSMWNGSAWIPFSTMPDESSSSSHGFTVPEAYVINGALWVRFKHLQSGASGHYLIFDLLRLDVEEAGDILELDWFMIGLWLVVTALSLGLKKYPITAIGSIFGFYLAVYFYDTSFYVALVLFSVNLYLLYDSLLNWDHTQ